MVRGEKAREVLNRINIIGFTTQLQNVDTKLPNEEVKRLKNHIIEQFVARVVDFTKEESIAIKVGILFTFGNSIINKLLLETGDESFSRYVKEKMELTFIPFISIYTAHSYEKDKYYIHNDEISESESS